MSYLVMSSSGALRALSAGNEDRSVINKMGMPIEIPWYQQLVLEGRVFTAQAGLATSPATFAGVYDADAPDFHLHIPNGTTVIPLHIKVIYEAVGTETSMEIIALASNTGDPSATGTATTIYNMRVDGPRSSACTCTAAIDAAGITDPNANNYFEFWKYQRPLTDTVATGENDRLPLVFDWVQGRDGPAPVIIGHATRGSALAVYANSQAPTGFIIVTWAEIPSENIS